VSERSVSQSDTPPSPVELADRGKPQFYLRCLEDGAILLVEHPTGIEWEVQVGGIACWHPVVEGFYLILDYRQGWKRLADLTCQLACCSWGFSRDAVDQLKEIWPPARSFPWWYCEPDEDPERLRKATEAWIPVLIHRHPRLDHYSGYREEEANWLDGKRGWLYLENCD